MMTDNLFDTTTKNGENSRINIHVPQSKLALIILLKGNLSEYSLYLDLGIINLVRTQNFPKKPNISYPMISGKVMLGLPKILHTY